MKKTTRMILLFTFMFLSCENATDEKELGSIEFESVNTVLPFTDYDENYYLVGDDILISKKDKKHMEWVNSFSKESRSKGARRLDTSLWPNKVVSYSFSRTVPQNHIPYILDKMKEWEDVSGVQFVRGESPVIDDEHSGGQEVPAEYTLFIKHTPNAPKSSASLGYMRYPTLNYGNLAHILHELGHVMGFLHEHQRHDRDNYVNVNMSNMTDFVKTQYVKIGSSRTYSSYDYKSVMHYGQKIIGGSTVFSKKNGDTSDHLFGGNTLTESDKLSAVGMYPLDLPPEVVGPANGTVYNQGDQITFVWKRMSISTNEKYTVQIKNTNTNEVFFEVVNQPSAGTPQDPIINVFLTKVVGAGAYVWKVKRGLYDDADGLSYPWSDGYSFVVNSSTVALNPDFALTIDGPNDPPPVIYNLTANTEYDGNPDVTISYKWTKTRYVAGGDNLPVTIGYNKVQNETNLGRSYLYKCEVTIENSNGEKVTKTKSYTVLHPRDSDSVM